MFDQDKATAAANEAAASERHAKLQALRAPFPPEKISRKPKGGAMLDYVGHADITERLLDIDPEWNWQPCRWHEGVPEFERDKSGKPVGLWIRLTVCGVTRLGYGSVDSTAFDAEKQLIGDALRNGAMRFGVALELWSKTERTASASAPQVKAQRVERQLAPKAPAAPAPQAEDDGFMDRLVNKFDGGEDTVPFDSATGEVVDVTEVNGVPITHAYNPEAAYSQTLPFGKHKGMTLRALAASNEGAGYLRWLGNKIADQFKQGKQPSAMEEYALMVVHDLQSKGAL